MTTLAPIPEAFFTDRLMTQRAAAPHTIVSYRDTCKLLLGYIHTQTGKPPSKLDLTGLDAATTGAFLNHLEAVRGNSAATRNNRLAAIHSLFHYAALRAPDHLNLISRVLAIQAKRTTTTIISSLTSAELDVFLSAPDHSTWHGRRDHALLVLAAQTELRGSELTGLTIDDFLATFLTTPRTYGMLFCSPSGSRVGLRNRTDDRRFHDHKNLLWQLQQCL